MNDTPKIENDNMVLTGHHDAPAVYADGVAQIMMGYPLSRLVMFRVTEPALPDGSRKEARAATQVITLPTLQLVEMCREVLRIATLSGTQFEQAAAAHVARMNELIASTEICESSGQATRSEEADA